MSELATTTTTIAKPQERIEFENLYSHAKVLALSTIVPAHLREGGTEVATANCFVALQLAKEMNENPINVLQNIYFVSGKAAWSSQYMIARANRSKKFKGGLRFQSKGTGDDLAVTCWATDAETEERLEKTVTMRMAVGEGWGKGGNKYKTMPEQMLTYRAAAFFIRVYCPEVMIGPAHSVDELTDEVLPVIQDTKPKLSIATVMANSIPKEIITESGEVVTVPPTTEPKPDMLASLLVEIEKRGGLATFYEQQQTDDMVIANMSKPSRSKLCTAANAFLTTLIQDAGE